MQPATLRFPREGTWNLRSEAGVLVDNVAIDGLLVVTKRAIPVGTEVEVTVVMPNEVQTSCAGKIVRVITDLSSDGAVGLGIECTRPFSEPFRVGSN